MSTRKSILTICFAITNHFCLHATPRPLHLRDFNLSEMRVQCTGERVYLFKSTQQFGFMHSGESFIGKWEQMRERDGNGEKGKIHSKF